MSDVVLLTHEGPIGTLTINRPDKLNALNPDVLTGVSNALAECREKGTRCLIVTGAGKAFVAGADITEFIGADVDSIRKRFTDNAVEAIWNLTKPTIAMVDGFALGGGCEIACSCDIRVSSDRSTYGTPEINLGLIPGYGATQRLERLVGYGKAHEMVMTGDMVPAEEAHRIGLTNHVVSPGELEATVFAMARRIGSKSSHTLAVGKRTVRAALDVGLSEGIGVELDEFSQIFASEDQEIGVRAFVNRETAEWKHR